MTERRDKRGLGRGLSALMGELSTDTGGQMAVGPDQRRTVPIDELAVNPDQPRRTFPPDEIEELSESIRAHGVLQPLIVRPLRSEQGTVYQIVAGERRWRAAQKARLHEVPVIVRELDDDTTLQIALVENIQRADLGALEEAQAYFNRAGDVSVIEVFLDDADRVFQARQAINAAIERPILLTDWTQRNRTFFAALEVERNVMFIILTLIVLVAALNIVSGLIMLVKDKSHDIAILRTMGATRGAIMRIFLITGASIGIVGTVAGLILGLVFTYNIEAVQNFFSWVLGQDLWDPTVRFLSDIPAEVDPTEVVAVLVMAFVLSLLATLYPSWRAARLDPVQALRYG